MLAASSGSLELVDIFLEAGTDVNARDKVWESYYSSMTYVPNHKVVSIP